jgi:hypothetical protein
MLLASNVALDFDEPRTVVGLHHSAQDQARTVGTLRDRPSGSASRRPSEVGEGACSGASSA